MSGVWRHGDGSVCDHGGITLSPARHPVCSGGRDLTSYQEPPPGVWMETELTGGVRWWEAVLADMAAPRKPRPLPPGWHELGYID